MMGVVVFLSRRSPEFNDNLRTSFSSTWRYRAIGEILVTGILFNCIGPLSMVLSEKYIPTGVMSVTFCLEPIFASFALAYIESSESSLTSTLSGALGCGLAMLGCTLVAYPDIEASSDLVTEIGYTLLAVVSVISYAVGIAAIKAFSKVRAIHPVILVAGNCFVGWVFALATQLSMDPSGLGQIVDMTITSWAFLLYYAVGCTVLCWIVLIWLGQRIGPAASLNAFLVPIISLVLGIVFNREWDGFSSVQKVVQCMGLVIVLAGLYLILAKELSSKPNECDFIEISMGYGSFSIEMEANEDTGLGDFIPQVFGISRLSKDLESTPLCSSTYALDA